MPVLPCWRMRNGPVERKCITGIALVDELMRHARPSARLRPRLKRIEQQGGNAPCCAQSDPEIIAFFFFRLVTTISESVDAKRFR